MKKVVKQGVGTAVSQKELIVALGSMFDDFLTALYAYMVLKKS